MYIDIKSLTNKHSQRVTIKGTIQRIIIFSTKNGEAMTTKIKDAENTEIHCIFWPKAWQQFKHTIKEFQCYEFRNFTIQKFYNAKYNKTKHRYQIIINLDTIIRKTVVSIFIKSNNDRKIECVQIQPKRKRKKSKVSVIKQPVITNFFI